MGLHHALSPAVTEACMLFSLSIASKHTSNSTVFLEQADHVLDERVHQADMDVLRIAFPLLDRETRSMVLPMTFRTASSAGGCWMP